jgi:ribosomal protein S18 acetylase RimI-like enzyme
MSELVIRDARPEETEPISELTRAAYAEYQDIMTPAAYAGVCAAIDTALSTTQPVERIIALRDDRIVGSVMLYAASADAYSGLVAQASCPVVRMLAVSPADRGGGIGLELMQECIRRARAAGARELGLHTSASMRAAIRLYEGMGFRREPAHDFQPVGAELVTAYRLAL